MKPGQTRETRWPDPLHRRLSICMMGRHRRMSMATDRTREGATMSRLQLALNVDDIDTAVEFYSTLFDTPPAKRRPGYANFAVENPALKLVLIENPEQTGTLNHLGVERDSMAE